MMVINMPVILGAMDGTVKPDGSDLLAHGYITGGPNRGAQVLTSARGSGWETTIRLPTRSEPPRYVATMTRWPGSPAALQRLAGRLT
jgi:hypothetical protein